MSKLLLVEDDPKLADLLAGSLTDSGLTVSHARNQADLEQWIKGSSAVDIVVLDRLLGNFDTKSLVPQIREKWPHVLILVLSAINTPIERAELINSGCDDYVGKPFSIDELIARIRAFLRRSSSAESAYQCGNLIVDSVKRTVVVSGQAETFPAKEFLVLKTLCQELGRVWSKNDLLEEVWGQSTDLQTNVVEATIANLRRKLAELSANVVIRNMRYAGYWIEESG
jgi:DNA-binding response OmpR family regulator